MLFYVVEILVKMEGVFCCGMSHSTSSFYSLYNKLVNKMFYIHLNLLFSFRMPGSGPKYYCCIKCKKRTNSTNRWFISGPAYKAYRKHLGLVSYEDTDVTCMNCYAQFYRKKRTNTVSNVQDNSDPCTTYSDYKPQQKS